MHLKKLLKLLEQGPKAFNMVKCHPLTSNKNSINLKMFHFANICFVIVTISHQTQVKWGGCAIISSLPMEEVNVCLFSNFPPAPYHLAPPWSHLLQVEIENRKSRSSQGRAEGLPGRRTFHPRFVTARIQVRTGGGSGGGGNFVY